MIKNINQMYVLYKNISAIYYKEKNKIFRANYSNQHQKGTHYIQLKNIKEITHTEFNLNNELKKILIQNGIPKKQTRKTLLEKIIQENKNLKETQQKLDYLLERLYISAYGDKK